MIPICRDMACKEDYEAEIDRLRKMLQQAVKWIQNDCPFTEGEILDILWEEAL